MESKRKKRERKGCVEEFGEVGMFRNLLAGNPRGMILGPAYKGTLGQGLGMEGSGLQSATYRFKAWGRLLV